jgi:hypothetical protein
MKSRRSIAVRVAVAAFVAVILLPGVSLACPVCYGPPDAPMVKGMNNAIGFLLGIVALVQIGFVALFVTFWRRARDQRRRFRVIDGGAAATTMTTHHVPTH